MPFAKILLFLAVGSNLTSTLIYLYSIAANKVKPHSFTFLVWSIILGINFSAQIVSGVGIAATLLATNFFACIIIFLACLAKGHTEHDKKDIICLVLGILSIILWLLTKHPIYSVTLSCFIDLFAFIPSFRKSFNKPHEDSALAYYISGFEYIFSFPSYSSFSLVSLMYPVWVTFIDISYASMISNRRRQLRIAKSF